MNFVFVSPHFPDNVYLYCQALYRNGVTVLGIGDTPWEALPPHTRQSLTDYYQVPSLEDRDAMVRALGWFTWKHGQLDWLESNNEYWLEQDAWLREQFHILTGPQPAQLPGWQRKSLMKQGYERAGVATAPWAPVTTLPEALAFADRVGYPLILKPDKGVGAGGTHRLDSARELSAFFERLPIAPCILEKCISGSVLSYDALIDSRGDPLYETGNITPGNIMDMVNKGDDCVFYIVPEPAADVVSAGRRCAKAFGVKSRLVHFEFFRLDRDQEGLGRAGGLLGLEVNMRPSGGYSSDMINFAGSVDIYRMWADMILRDRVWPEENRQKYFCVFLGRRDRRRYTLSHEQLMEAWGHRIAMAPRIPAALSDVMGDQGYLVRCRNEEEMASFLSDAKKEA